MAINPKSLDNLQPPIKGEVRNPNGRPKGIPNAKTRYLRLLTLTEKIKNPVTGELEEFSIMEQLDMQMIAKARKGDLNAYKEIMDRLEGKAQQKVDMHLGIEPIDKILTKFGISEGETDADKTEGSES
jgi:hypothetical protein